jgi:hypothetical protein
MASCHTLDQLHSSFDPTHAVANAGLLLAATLAQRLGIEQAADALLDLGERAGAYRPGRRLLPLVDALLAGGDGIDDADLLGCGATSQLLGHRVMALHPGTFLRAFTFGHARQLDRACEQLLMRAWAAGAGPGDGPMTMDLDSTVCEVHGDHQQGAASGYTHTLGYYPPLATRADTARGTARFVDELAARAPRGRVGGAERCGWIRGSGRPRPSGAAAATGSATRSPCGRPRRSRAAIATIDEAAWTDIVYPEVAWPRSRDPLPGRPADRGSHPPDRRPGRAVPELALPRLCHRPSRHHRRA